MVELSMSDDLINFLRERLAEAEERARRADGTGHFMHSQWTAAPITDDADDMGGWGVKAKGFYNLISAAGDGVSRAVAEHIAAQDPAHTVADVQVKRRAIDNYEKLRRYAEAERREEYVLAEGAGAVFLKLMALPHSDHPDYRKEWKP